MLEAALAAGVAAAGGEVLLGGVLPTPAAPLLVRRYGFDLAAVLSASHNPYRDNGIKFFGGDGFKLSDATELEIERRLEERLRPAQDADGGPAIGRVRALHGTQEDYLRALHERFADLDLSGVRVALDCANGATHRVAPEIFRRLGATVTVVGDAPDGRNINAGCGSTHLDGLVETVTTGGHDVGFAFDGDGDRVLAVDRNGAVVDGDELVALAALHLRRAGRLVGRRRRRDGDDELRLPRRDGGGRDRGREHAGRRPLRPRGPARARLGPRRRAVRPHHRAGLRPVGRRHRQRAPDSRGARGRRPRAAQRDAQAAPAPRQRARRRPRRRDGGPGGHRRERRRRATRSPAADACSSARAGPSRSCA